MQAGRRYTFFQVVNWTRRYIILFTIWGTLPVCCYYFLNWHWLHLPWQPLSLIGIAVAFYLGFKNNSSYERLWEARKIWGGIVNTSRSFTVASRDFITDQFASNKIGQTELHAIHKRLINRHIAWIKALTYQLRMVQPWEHTGKFDQKYRQYLGTTVSEKSFEALQEYLSPEDYAYVMKKGNRASHILSIQSSDIKKLRQAELVEDFRHMELQAMITEFYTLQGQSERIKNFPFPRQYASVNYYFTIIFILMLPFGMVDIFSSVAPAYMIWLTIPFSVISSWVFWCMEMIGDYSENPFEGLYNDVPINAIATSIEIDIRQMLDEEDGLPEVRKPVGTHQILN